VKRLNDLVVLTSRSGWLYLLSIVAAFGSLFFVFGNINAVMLDVTGHDLFDLQNSLTVAQVFEQSRAYTPEAKQLYYAFSFVDFFFPFFAALFMAATAAFALRHGLPDFYRKMNAASLFTLLFTPTVFDWIENVLALIVVSGFPEQRETAASLMVLAKKAKLGAIVAAQLMVLAALLASAVAWIRVRANVRR